MQASSSLSKYGCSGSLESFICEICGHYASCMESFKFHLNNECKAQSNRQDEEDNENATDSRFVSTQKNRPKINTILSNVKAVSLPLSSGQGSPGTIINIPQSMTVFNLKEILTKLKKFQSSPIQNSVSDNQAETKLNSKPNTAKSILNALNVNTQQNEISLYEEKKNESIENIQANLNEDVSIKNSIKKEEEFSDESVKRLATTSSTINPSLPYHYSKYENLYVCNLCNCTYDSLRSIKAHIWKHSGHHELNYPIHDYNRSDSNVNNSSLTSNSTTTCNSKIISIKKSIKCLQLPLKMSNLPKSSLDSTEERFLEDTRHSKDTCVPDSSNGSKLTSNTNNNSSGGICKVLLEVIEKLRDEESSTRQELNEKETTTRRSNFDKEKCHRNKLLRNSQRTKRRKEEEKDSGKKKDVEYKIETSVVNSLFDEDSLDLKQNSNGNLIYICFNCFKTFKQTRLLAEHKLDCNYSNANSHLNGGNSSSTSSCSSVDTEFDEFVTKRLKADIDSEKAKYACDLCNFSTQLFSGVEALRQHYNLHHNKSQSKSKHKSQSHILKADNLETDRLNQSNLKNNSTKELNLTNLEKQANITSLLHKLITIQTISSSTDNQTTIEENNNDSSSLISLLSSLAENDGFEQYVCGLCSYVCYHLPSLKSHLWSHVKDTKFNYSINTSIINAALDYENKLTRKLNSIKKSKLFLSGKEESNETKNSFIQRQLVSALELIKFSGLCSNESVTKNKTEPSSSTGVVSFRCSKCGFETVDLFYLRLHKRDHYQTSQTQSNNLMQHT